MLRRSTIVIIVCASAIGLAACGIKGPLKAPPAKQSETPPATSTAPSPASPPRNSPAPPPAAPAPSSGD